jgi:predicted metal-dependent HD superfamily phosphohydrolase
MTDRPSTDRLIDALRALRSDALAIVRGEEPAVAALAERVVAGWTEPHRSYHTIEHLGECLAWLDDPEVRGAIERPAEVELALWLHDLVYDTRRGDNEHASAEEGRGLLGAVGGIDPAVIERIAAMVESTKDHGARSADGAVMLDIDLSILGADPARFARYESQIREEYGWVEPDAYRAGRRAVLARFAARPRLFLSDALHDRLEARARENLARALAE